MLDKKKSSSSIKVFYEGNPIRGKTLHGSQSEKGGEIISICGKLAGKERTKTSQGGGFLNVNDAKLQQQQQLSGVADENTNNSSFGRKNTSRINKENVTDIAAIQEKKQQEQKDLNKIYVDDETAK